MFETQLALGLKNVKVKAEHEDGITTRTCYITLTGEFEDLVAAGMGADAKKALASLQAGGMTSCVLPIDRLLCEARLVSDGKSLHIDRLKGTKASAKAGKPEEPIRIDLEFEFMFNREAWIFLGEHAGAAALVTLNRVQLGLLDAGKTKSANA